jgi:hypothetical protein
MPEEKEQEIPAVAEAAGCVVVPFLFIFLLFCAFMAMRDYKAEQDTKLEAERYEIEGRVSALEMIDVPSLSEKMEQREKETGEKKPNIIIQVGKTFDKKTKITFEDGREKEFNGVYKKPIEIGKYYLITYDGHDCIIDAVEKGQNDAQNDNQRD